MCVFRVSFWTKGLEDFWFKHPRIVCEPGCNFPWKYFPISAESFLKYITKSRQARVFWCHWLGTTRSSTTSMDTASSHRSAARSHRGCTAQSKLYSWSKGEWAASPGSPQSCPCHIDGLDPSPSPNVATPHLTGSGSALETEYSRELSWGQSSTQSLRPI